MERYEVNWNALRSARVQLYSNAMNGDSAAVGALRDVTMHAGVFATLSVHNTVVNQEKQYANWQRGMPIRGLGYHVRAAQSVGAWIASSFDLMLYGDMSGHTLVDSLIEISGLGPAKATFMGALLGYDECPCIDVHMARMYGLAKQFANLRQYRAAVALSPFRDTLMQWHAFMIVPKFAADQHDIYFDAVLPIAHAAFSRHAHAHPIMRRLGSIV